MPPQLDEQPQQQDEGAASPKDAAPEAQSYWDAPAETALDGKTLSTMDLTMMVAQHPGEAEKKECSSYKPQGLQVTPKLPKTPIRN